MVASSIRLLKRWLAYGLIEAIPEMAASDQDSQADAKQHVPDNCAGDGRLDHIHQTMAQGEYAENEIRQGAHGGVQQPARGRSQMRGQVFGGLPHHLRQRDDRHGGHEEHEHRIGMANGQDQPGRDEEE